MSIEIPISASFNSSQAEQRIAALQKRFNELGRAAEKVGDVQFKPLDNATARDLEQMAKRFEALQRAAPGLRDRLHESGNAGRSWHDTNWSKAFPDDHQRTRYLHTLVTAPRPKR